MCIVQCHTCIWLQEAPVIQLASQQTRKPGKHPQELIKLSYKYGGPINDAVEILKTI